MQEIPAATVQLDAEEQDASRLQQQHSILQQHEPTIAVSGAVLPSAHASRHYSSPLQLCAVLGCLAKQQVPAVPLSQHGVVRGNIPLLN